MKDTGDLENTGDMKNAKSPVRCAQGNRKI